jgi:uncharacterized protein YcnI
MRTWTKIAALCTVLSLSLAGAALAHVEISPDTVSGGQTVTYSVEVPTEKEVPTTEVELSVPEGFEVTGVEAPEGWRGEGRGGSIVWTGGEVPVAESEEFAFEARAPEEAGEFAFDAAQTYGDGSVANWDGAADSETPAPVVTVETVGSVAGVEDGHQHGDKGRGDTRGSHAEEVPDTGGPGPVFVLGACAAALVATALLLRSAVR